MPPVLFVSGDDDWIVAEAVKRASAAFSAAFREGEVSSYAAPGANVKEAVADAATVALFSTNRLVVLEGTDLLRSGKVTADELDAILDEASETRARSDDERSLARLARKARALAAAAGIAGADPDDMARRLTGRVKRSGRAEELAALLSAVPEDEEAVEGAL